jgi:hypothetical protein
MKEYIFLLAAVAALTVAIILGLSIRARHKKPQATAHKKPQAMAHAMLESRTSGVPAPGPKGDLRYRVIGAYDLSGHAGGTALAGLKLAE